VESIVEEITMPAPRVLLNSKKDNKFGQLRIGDTFVINTDSYVPYIRVKIADDFYTTLGVGEEDGEQVFRWSGLGSERFTVQRVKITDIVAEYE